MKGKSCSYLGKNISGRGERGSAKGLRQYCTCHTLQRARRLCWSEGGGRIRRSERWQGLRQVRAPWKTLDLIPSKMRSYWRISNREVIWYSFPFNSITLTATLRTDWRGATVEEDWRGGKNPVGRGWLFRLRGQQWRWRDMFRAQINFEGRPYRIVRRVGCGVWDKERS